MNNAKNNQFLATDTVEHKMFGKTRDSYAAYASQIGRFESTWRTGSGSCH